MGPNCSRQDPGRPHVDPMNLVIWDAIKYRLILVSCLWHCSRKGVRIIKNVVESIKISDKFKFLNFELCTPIQLFTNIIERPYFTNCYQWCHVFTNDVHVQWGTKQLISSALNLANITETSQNCQHNIKVRITACYQPVADSLNLLITIIKKNT